MDLGSSSSPVITVAPVVVMPEMDSNRASVKDRCTSSTNNRGRVPVTPSTTQNNTVITKPSRLRSSLGVRLNGSHMSMPRENVRANARKKDEAVCSS